MARGVVGIERIELIRPIRQNPDQFTAFQEGRETHGEALEHSLARHAGGDRDGRIVEHQAT